MAPEGSPQGENVLTHAVSVAALPPEGRSIRFEPSASERAELARFLDVAAVDALSAEIVMAPWRGGGVSIEGRLDAVIVQESVVTLEPVRQTIQEPVSLRFLPERGRAGQRAEAELDLDPEGEDPPETFSSNRIDLGAALREIVVLALDPYPRAGGDRFEDAPQESAADEGKVSPFAALARLKRDAGDAGG